MQDARNANGALIRLVLKKDPPISRPEAPESLSLPLYLPDVSRLRASQPDKRFNNAAPFGRGKRLRCRRALAV